MSMRQKCGVKKGAECLLLVFTPGGASLSSEVTALATVMTLAETRRTEPGRVKGHLHINLVLFESLVNSEPYQTTAQEGHIHTDSASPPKKSER